MTKKISIICITILMITMLFVACGKKEEAQEAEATPTPLLVTEAPQATLPDGKLIGVSLSDSTPFNLEFQKHFEQAYVNSEYNVVTMFADGSYDKQVSDLADMLSKVELLILDPSDLDNLEYILSEYEVNNIPVINLNESVNAHTKMLIGPFYRQMGKEIGNYTFTQLDKITKQQKYAVILRGNVDSSKMQYIYDGVTESLEDYKYTELVEAPACNYDYDRTVEQVTRVLQENAKIHCIFAETSDMAIAAIDAIDATGKSGVYITTIGGDDDCLRLVEDGRIDAAIFYGPNDLASITATYADRILENPEVLLPQFVEMNYEIITKKNVSTYRTGDSDYALAAKGTEPPPDPTPVPEAGSETETEEEE